MQELSPYTLTQRICLFGFVLIGQSICCSSSLHEAAHKMFCWLVHLFVGPQPFKQPFWWTPLSTTSGCKIQHSYVHILFKQNIGFVVIAKVNQAVERPILIPQPPWVVCHGQVLASDEKEAAWQPLKSAWPLLTQNCMRQINLLMQLHCPILHS